ncbi:15.0 kDa protein [Seminavis robusta]|uniref:15.0 kDa protein n=1 Tax=Seminavis robusta TaxID=568900 RepID=A0A9N8ETX0_9STRA|nr:15.0 kDa protein [Seminavis robusta]|eukprot:Sro1863_g302350.1 15.0 kDa protein (249) ;mRNA; f:18118-19103
MRTFSIACTTFLLLASGLDCDAFAPNGQPRTATEQSTWLAATSQNNSKNAPSRRSLLSSIAGGTLAGLSYWVASPPEASARLEAVNRPDLLPSDKNLNVIQVEKFLTSGQAKRLDTLLANLEKETGFRVRVLCQRYPNTPGLAIRDYWDLGKEGQKDDKYIVLVVDEFGGKGNVLNFNVGDGVKFALPNVFWTRLQAKYGTTFYVRDNGIDLSIVNAIEAVVTCLRSEDGFCTSVPDEGLSLKSLGMS